MILTNTRSKVLKISVVPIALIVVGVLAFLFVRGLPAGPPDFKAPAPVSPAIESKWGIHITMIGVTADGGMIDFRYQVIDPDKALAMTDNMANVPTLVDEQSGALINSAALMVHRTELHAGQTYFLLYRNTDGAIKRGSSVTVKVGDLQLQHVIAK